MAEDRDTPARRPEPQALDWPASTSAQLNALLDDPRAPELVREMPSVQLHRLVAMVGRADSAELLAMAGPQQIRELLDLDLWQGDRLQVAEAMDWLQFLTDLPSALEAVDVELIGLVLLNRFRVHVIEDADDAWTPADAVGPLDRTPDGWFLLELVTEDPSEQQQVHALVEELYANDPERTRRLLHQLVGEIPTELEEMCYRWRNGRLQDLGFADPEEALLVYSYLDPRSISPDEGSGDSPLRSDPEASGRSDIVRILPAADCFWHRAVARVEDLEERERLGAALLAVSNRTIAADQVAPSDLTAIQKSLEALQWRLSLGLEQLCEGDPARAPEVLAGVALLRIARLGHSLALDARRTLLGPLREGRLGSAPGRLDRIDPPLSLRLRALAAARPAWYEAAERRARPFRTLAELAEAKGWIVSALAAAGLAEDLPLPRPWPAQLTFGDLYRTQVVNDLLGREGPLDADALARFVREKVRGGAVAAALPSLIGQVPAGSLEATWVESWIRDLEQRLAPLDPDHLDLRFIGGFWLAR